MQPDTVIKLSKKQHDDLMQWVRNCYMFLGGNDINLRAALEYKDRVYYRENDWTKEQMRARWANYWGDAKRLQNMTVPVVGPQVETAVGYMMEVYCTGEPFFGVVAPPASANAALQMEAVISDNSRRFGWRGEFIKSFRDGMKYNIMPMEMSWEKKKVFSIINDPQKRESDAGVRAENMYAGNFAKRIDPYNMIVDTRVNPNLLHTKGEFVGYVELEPRTAMKQKVIDLGSGNTTNVTEALKSNCNMFVVGNNQPGQYYVPLINPLALINPTRAFGQNWMAWVSGINNNGTLEYKDLYEVATIYARFMPSDFGLTSLPAQNTPQIFKLIVVNQQYIIFCQRMTNAHNYLPIIIGQPFDDGLGYQAKSFGDNVAPYQEMSSALWNSGIESKRKLVYDRIFYDPSRINETDINQASSVARIPVRSAAYGKPVQDAYSISQYRDDNVVGTLQMAQQVMNMAEVANGTNRPSQGQFQKGNKTRFEFETTMQGGNVRPRMFAITLEDSFMNPLKEIVKMNILQYQGRGDIFNMGTEKMQKIDPQELRSAIMEFKLSDGQTPTDKLLNSDVLGQVAQLAMSVPAVNAEYDVMKLLDYTWKQNGVQVDEFKRTPEEKQAFMQDTAAMSAANAEPKNRETPSQSAQNSPEATGAN